MIINLLLTIVGFIVLIKSADFFVDGAASFARNVKIPTLIVGLTIVSFGTSAPELAISFSSHIAGNGDMLMGNVVGSNISNILVILGIAIIIMPFNIPRDAIGKEIPILFLITVGASILLLDNVFDPSQVNSLSRADGIMLIVLFSIFVYYLITIMLRARDGTEVEEEPKFKLPKSVLFTVAGLLGVIFAADLVVDNVTDIAEAIGISQKIIAVTIVSIGTSLPELVTVVVAAKKGENSMALGSIVGSNIFNTCIVLGLPIAILGEISTTTFGYVDALFMLVAVGLLEIFSVTDRSLKRIEGVFLIGIYVLYAAYVFMQ
ncbi:MAG: calcium/sodium antiporter [Clostridiales bacterium]|nr:calcium/sodium antiporter [Clostridiales bacterium]